MRGIECPKGKMKPSILATCVEDLSHSAFYLSIQFILNIIVCSYLETVLYALSFNPLNINDIGNSIKTSSLGLHIDSHLTYKKHIDYLSDKFWGRIALAISLIGRSSPLSLENKLILYKQILRPTITYGSPT
ncbi:hypothetical protein TNCV_1428571 [Trichonephila clavipes]|nr:hypothetical protein TNCV_1428571 [Trichonephila clavipes]